MYVFFVNVQYFENHYGWSWWFLSLFCSYADVFLRLHLEKMMKNLTLLFNFFENKTELCLTQDYKFSVFFSLFNQF